MSSKYGPNWIADQPRVADGPMLSSMRRMHECRALVVRRLPHTKKPPAAIGSERLKNGRPNGTSRAHQFM